MFSRSTHTALEMSCPSSSMGGEVAISTSSMSVASLVREKLDSIREMKGVQEVKRKALLFCPICQTKFQKSDFPDEAKFDAYVCSHMLSCSKKSEPSLSNKFAQQIQKFKSTEAQKSNGKDKLGCRKPLRIKEGSVVLLDDANFQNNSQHSNISNFVRRLPQDKSYRIITDPRHFLMQSWWKQKSNCRQAVTSVQFNIQACVVPMAVDQSSHESYARLRSRNNISEGLESSLQLQCPICGRKFASDWTGCITEESMSRHVAKCSDRLFRSGSMPSQFAHTHGDATVSHSRKRSLKPIGRDSTKNEQEHKRRRIQKRRVMSQTQCEQRRNAIVQRTVSMTSIRKCDLAHSLLVTYLSTSL